MAASQFILSLSKGGNDEFYGGHLMWYAIIGQDVPNSLDKRKAARPAHLARLQALQDEGRLLLAGPFPAVDRTIRMWRGSPAA